MRRIEADAAIRAASSRTFFNFLAMVFRIEVLHQHVGIMDACKYIGCVDNL
jgi:hypothetical protein